MTLENYEDITEILFSSVQNIKDHKVVKSEYFNLLEGTRAVEVDNAKLDTGMINLKEEDLAFDPSSPQSVDAVIATTDYLLCQLMSWLNNSSLPVTVLSCRYVQTILQNYSMQPHDSKSLYGCTLHDSRIESSSTAIKTTSSSKESILVHLVLRAYLIGLTKFIGFCINVGLNILYEEEDLTTRRMDLDFLSEIPTVLVVKELNEAISWLEIQSDEKEKMQELKQRLQIVSKMNQIEDLLNTSTSIFELRDFAILNLEFLLEAITLVDNIAKLDKYSEHVPKGSFSKFAQLDLNNKSIPADLYTLEPSMCFNSFKNMFSDLYKILKQTENTYNIHQFQCLLEHEVSNNMTPDFNVFVRGLYQLFLIRDNKSIVGSKESTMTLTNRLLESFTTMDSSIFQIDNWPVKEAEKQNLLSQFDQLMMDLESIVYHTVSSTTNNRCRQRQLMSRSLLVWDTLQVSAENFEIYLWETHKIGDEINNVPTLPISSFVYYNKLVSMIDISLRGFELDLYKDFEVCQIYWYVSYLSQLVFEHLIGRVNNQIELKINYINSGMTKKIKKLKAGTKKQQLKELQNFKQENVLPKLQKIQNYNQGYLAVVHEALFKLSDATKLFLIILHLLKIFDLLKGPKLNLTSMEFLYNLRMKPFSSIGVPNLPTFDQYKKCIELRDVTSAKIKHIILICTTELKNAQQLYEKVLNFVKSNESQFIGEGVKSWCNNMISVCQLHLSEVKKLEELVELGDFDSTRYKVKLSPGPDKYFPQINVVEK